MENDKLWCADMGNGIYRNPILFADFSDPDVVRSGDVYYMTASSFNYTPGLPILESKDLVNWKPVNYAVENIEFPEYKNPQHSKGIWAPAIRFHDGWYYIYYGMPDEGIFMVKTKHPCKRWEAPVLVLEGKGLIDPCPIWDDDGKAYVIHAYANSRIGFKSYLGMFEMSFDGERMIGEDHLIFDGTKTQMTIEGPKVYKRNDWYYIFAPAGGVSNGWQTVLRSKNIYGPYEEKIVMRQGDTLVNGPHQGALVDTPLGEEWFLHFQDRGAYGRIVHLQPVIWKEGWPVIGRPKEGQDWGEPYLFHKKPGLPPANVTGIAASNGFDGEKLGLNWQWLGNHRKEFWSLSERPGYLRLYSLNPSGQENTILWHCSNILTQKIMCPEMVMDTHMEFIHLKEEEQAGVIVIGDGYGWLGIHKRSDRQEIVFVNSKWEAGVMREQDMERFLLPKDQMEIWFRIQISEKEDVEAEFFFSLNGQEYKKVNHMLTLSAHTWVGAKTGIFAVACNGKKHEGYADFSEVVYKNTKKEPEPEFLIAKEGELETVKYLVEYTKSSMNVRDETNRTVLHYAVQQDDVTLVRYLVERVGLSPLDADKKLITPFEEAYLLGCSEVLAYFEEICGGAFEDMYKNPVRTGMYPDPSVIRHGEDYYMVNSSFIYFPCIPIAHSKDLVHWETIGYAIENSEWAQLSQLEGGRGYWAPDISYSEGRFYITATYRMNDGGVICRKQMIVSSDKPQGPYTKPVFIEEDGIDPSLFHDDGRHYMLLNRGARILELNQEMTASVSKARLLYYGDCKRAPEGPHLLKKDGYYYLFLAEGGTGMGHQITVARSRSLEEPFEPCPYNPILQQRDPNALIQRCGHGKPVQTQDGRWYMFYLCGRMPDGLHTFLGRETALDPIVWTEDGWPLVNDGKGPGVLQKKPFPTCVTGKEEHYDGWSVEFKDGKISGEWLSPRGRRAGEIVALKDGILIKGDAWEVDNKEARNLLLRRQSGFCFEAEMAFTVNMVETGDNSGMICYYDEHTWLKCGIVFNKSKGRLFVEENKGDWNSKKELISVDGSAQKIYLRIVVDGVIRKFYTKFTTDAEWNYLTTCAPVDYLCDEGYDYGKRFTGPMIGVYTVGKKSEALFHEFWYRNI